MGEGWRKSKKPRHPENDSTGKRFDRLWAIDRWLIRVVWSEFEDGSEIHLKIAAYDDALEDAVIALGSMQAAGKAMDELGRIDGAGEVDEMMKLAEKQSRLKRKFEESVRLAEALLADLLFELIMPMWSRLRKLTKESPGEAEGVSGSLEGGPVPPATPAGEDDGGS